MFKKIFVLLSSLLVLVTLVACTAPQTVTNVSEMKVEALSSKNKVTNQKKTKIGDSFYDDNGNWYYVIEVGAISRMPLQGMNNTGMIRWSQNSTAYEKTISSTVTDATSMRESVENQVVNAISSEIETKITDTTNINASAKISAFKIVEAQLGAAKTIVSENLWKSSSSYQSTYKNSFEQVSSRTSTETISETIKFDSTCPTGYYGWNLCGNVKVYAFIVYNPISEEMNISYITDIVASYWSFDYLTDEEFDNLTLGYTFEDFIDFDLPELNEPEKYLDFETIVANQGKNFVNVSFDANGGYCNKSLMVAEGEAYAALPIPTYNSEKYFAGWYDEIGNKITNETVCIYGEDHTLIAKWGDAVISINAEDIDVGMLTVNKTKTYSFNIDRDALVESGYTACKVVLDFNIRGTTSVEDGVFCELILSNLGLGAIQMAAPYNGEHRVVSGIYYQNELIKTSNLSAGNNTLELRWSNTNVGVLNKTAKITGMKITITFYNPDEVQ